MIKAQVPSHDILNPIYIEDMQTDPHDSNTVSFQHPSHDITFSHEFITSEMEKFGLTADGCHKCSQLVQHFQDPRSLHDKVSENQIVWIQNPDAIMTCPLPNLKVPVHDPSNINIVQPHNRPCGFVRVSQVAKHIKDNGEFIRIVKGATVSILKNIISRPLATREVQFKLNQDIDTNVLISLNDFLQQPDVIARGINKLNVHNYLTAAGLLLMFNPQSQSSKV